MKKRILAIAMALIMLTGTSPLTVDASEIFNEPVTDVETLADAPKDETVVVEAQAVVNETAEPKAAPAADASATITNEPASEADAIVNSETTTPASKSVATPAPDGDKPADAPAPKEEQEPKKAPVQDAPEEEAEQKTPVTPSDAQEEAEEPVEDVVEIEEEKTPLAGPAPLGGSPTGRVFLVLDDWTIEPLTENVLNINWEKSSKNNYKVYVLPNTEFRIKRDGGGHCWWRWFELSETKEIYAQVEVRDSDINQNDGWKYAPYENHSDKYWAGGKTVNKFMPTIGIGQNASVKTKAVLRSINSAADGSAVKSFSVNELESTYTKILIPKDSVDTIIYVVKPVTVKYMMNDGTSKTCGNENALGITLGYTTTEEATSQKMTVLTAPDREDKRYTFVGWNTEQDGNGEWYKADSKFQITDDMTLYAQWKTECIVNYYLDGDLYESKKVEGYENQPIPAELYAENKYENGKFYFKEKNLENPTITADTILNVYYVSKANYTVNYYKDGKLVDTDVEKGEGKINESIPYDSQKYFGYSLKPIEGQKSITVEDEKNILNVYYEKTSGDLVIKTGNNAKTSIFEITGSNGFSMRVTVEGTLTIKSLPAGDYKVTELSGWTWRYNRSGNKEQSVTVPAKGEETADFGSSLAIINPYWYGADAQKVENHFNKIKAQKEGGTTND